METSSGRSCPVYVNGITCTRVETVLYLTAFSIAGLTHAWCQPIQVYLWEVLDINILVGLYPAGSNTVTQSESAFRWVFLSVWKDCCEHQVVTGKQVQFYSLYLQSVGMGNRIHIAVWQLFVRGRLLCWTLPKVILKKLIRISWCVSAHGNTVIL